jgi:tetratricopeptide (TPR) repeat protein/predicted nucleic acid-binding Zn ribbon protein
MCGGDIEPNAGQTFGTCDHCGTTMTLPRASDEQKVNLFNRANHFRRKSDFDQAVKAYENILSLDSAESEAHWGLVLSKYGIEYVEDPVTRKQVPTCHRVQSNSILADIDYLTALENAPDGYTRNLYEQEAKSISEIQKGILAVSSEEKPYDVFICYKETTDGGSRSKDSALAQDVYYQLVNEGYKVFFSRITLEDKLGQDYEPYIFAALNSSKVMLVIGTVPEHLNAVWVRNEWSRYLALMKKDRNKMLIPCYQGMDAYDLPSELSMLQSQDMSKIGFVQDLIRGIKKVLSGNNGTDTTTVSAVSSVSPGSASDAMLRRAFIVLEDGDWHKANELLEQALNLDPENSRAYVGKLLVTLKLPTEKSLSPSQNGWSENQEQLFLETPIDQIGDFQKALRFAASEYRAVLQGYEQTIQEWRYNKAVSLIDSVKNSNELKELLSRFAKIKGLINADALDALIEKCRSECIYQEAVAAKDARNFVYALEKFASIPGHKDAGALAKECRVAEENERKRKKRTVAMVLFFLWLIAILIGLLD